MKKAIVLGATGGTGAPIVEELLKRGIETTAFGRSHQKLKQLAMDLANPKHLSLKVGDVLNPKDLISACEGHEVIFSCANVPYNDMHTKLIPMGEAVMEAANQLGAKIVVVDGIYPYGRKTTNQATEDHPKNPHTKKGKIRLQYEQMVFSPRWNKANKMIVRLPDYYGPSANQASYLGSTLEGISAGKPSVFIGTMKVAREFVYLPDAAIMIVELAIREDAYEQNWHIPASGVISGRDFVKIAQRAAGTSKPVIPLGKMGLSFLGLFSPVMKEVVEMLYLTEEPFVLSGEKYKRLVGPIPATPYEIGIKATINTLMKRNEVKEEISRRG